MNFSAYIRRSKDSTIRQQRPCFRQPEFEDEFDLRCSKGGFDGVFTYYIDSTCLAKTASRSSLVAASTLKVAFRAHQSFPQKWLDGAEVSWGYFISVMLRFSWKSVGSGLSYCVEFFVENEWRQLDFYLHHFFIKIRRELWTTTTKDNDILSFIFRGSNALTKTLSSNQYFPAPDGGVRKS